MAGELTKKGKELLEKSRSMKYNAIDYVKTMMAWANDNLSQDEILEVINCKEGKVIGLDNLQKEVMGLEETLKMKRKELLKKTLALYFMKQDNGHKDGDSLVGFSESMNSLSSRDGRSNLH
ncbi:MAG: hypothetical protein KKC75_03655 [Nanoarchaeota archaeon]|nr:hypothetical protein [Nanoarchaeota archaeon]MBU1005106.1 hypothetical protein [Nanoarchaeota archaeon]MBU1945434.1 hypothetical protein [Nanoarchaeota archaeon]